MTKSLPNHIGFIMDGNGRWAKKRALPRKSGHAEGAKAFKNIVNYSKKIGLKYITFYVFSTENWKRPTDEIEAIMNLLRKYLDDIKSHIGEGVRLIFLGDKSVLADDIQRKMYALENDSKDDTEMTLSLAINYGGRADILNAVRHIGEKIQFGELKPSEITENTISDMLYTRDIPNVDLVIRTAGEMRLSNFLIWQTAYSEYYFTDSLWPDFTPKELDKAIKEYSGRIRKYGNIQ